MHSLKILERVFFIKKPSNSFFSSYDDVEQERIALENIDVKYIYLFYYCLFCEFFKKMFTYSL